MKFRNRTNAILYDSIEDVPCPEPNIPCERCRLFPTVGMDCMMFCRQHPEEAAHLMGCDYRYSAGDKVVLVNPHSDKSGTEVGTAGVVWNNDWKVALVRWVLPNGAHYATEVPVDAVRLYIPSGSGASGLPARSVDGSDTMSPRHVQLSAKEKAICELLGAKWITRGIGGNSVSLWRQKPTWTGKTLKEAVPRGIVANVDANEFPSVPEGTIISVDGVTSLIFPL